MKRRQSGKPFATVRRKVAELNNRDNHLILFDAPFDPPTINVHLSWPARSEEEQGNRWIRDHILTILQGAYSMLGDPKPQPDQHFLNSLHSVHIDQRIA